MSLSIYALAWVGAVALLWALARYIAKWIHWHAEVNRDIAGLQSQLKYEEERNRTAMNRIFDLNKKVGVEFKQ